MTWCIKASYTQWHLKHQFTLLADYVSGIQRGMQVGDGCLSCSVFGPQLGRLEVRLCLDGELESSGDFSADVLWLKLVVSQNTSGQPLGVVCPHRVVWASSQHSVRVPGEQDAV